MSRYLLAASMLAASTSLASAQFSAESVKIGVLDDLNGPYSSLGGPGSVAAAEMAAEDFGGKVNGKPIEIISATHSLSPDVGASVARRWYDTENVDAIASLCASNVAIAVQTVGASKNRVTLNACATSSAMTNESCSPYGVSWVYDTYAIAKVATAAAKPNSSWFFITANYNYGITLQQEITTLLERNGSKVVGSVRHPFPSPDMSSFLFQAQSSGADYVAIANAGGDMVTTLKQAGEFGLLGGKQQFLALATFEGDIRAVGPEKVAGTLVTSPFVWSRTEETRAWSDRFFEKTKMRPNAIQAGVYSAVSHYLKAIQAANTDEAGKVIEQMRKLPVNDFFAKNGEVRKDGRMVHELYLAEVKNPSEASGDWDIFKVLRTIAGSETVRPLHESACPSAK